jgi:predicted HD phosphohydrolase
MQADLFGNQPKKSGAKTFACAVCKKQHAPFGQGVAWRKGQDGEWFCFSCLPADYWKSTPLFDRPDTNTTSGT